MQRTMWPALTGLVIVIGLTVGALAWRVLSFDQPPPNLGTSDPAVGYAFYDGINRVLAGESPDTLERVVADGFVDHSGVVPIDRSTEELIAQLSELGRSAPGTRIVVDDLSAAAGTLLASIAPLTPSGMAVANMPLTIQPLAGGYDILRVRNGKVIERWSNGLPDLTTHTYDEATFTMGAPFSVAIRLDQLELPNDGRAQMRVLRQSVVVVEAGRVRLHLSWADSGGNPQSRSVLLDTGEAHLFTDDTRIEIKNEGTDPARFLRYSMRRVAPGEPWPLAMTGDASSTLLWMSDLPQPEEGYWRVSIGIMQLAAGADGALSIPAGSTLLLWSDQGTTHLDAVDGEISKLSPLSWPPPIEPSASFSAGLVGSVDGAKSVEVRNDAGGAVWVIAIEPVDAAMGTPVVY